MKSLITKIDNLAIAVSNLIHEAAIALFLRVSIFYIFWDSAQAKLAGPSIAGIKWQFWNVSESTVLLFDYEYGLPLIPADIAAYLATFGEFFLSLAILFGFLTRVSAFGLLIMTAVIQFLVYPELWKQHLIWAAMILYVFKYGAGKLSLDHLIKR